jgi:hypothetical protein
MDAEIIKEGAKTVRSRGARVASQAKRKVEAQAARSSSDVVVAMERAQRAAVDLGNRAYEQGERAYEHGERAARTAAREIGGRPWTAALLLGSALLAGAASIYLLQGGRRR